MSQQEGKDSDSMTPWIRPITLAGWMLLALPASAAETAPIDRRALVTRHNPTITAVDQSAPFMVGNGNIAFTADITGLQTFPEQYSPLVPLMTQAQWAWHSFPNPQGFTLEQAQVPINGARQEARKYPYLRDWDQATATRRSSGCAKTRIASRSAGLGCTWRTPMARPRHSPIWLATRQTLDMWTGRLAAASCSMAYPSRWKPPCIPIATASSCACVRRCWPTARLGRRSQISRRRRETQSGSGGLGTSRRRIRRRRSSRSAGGLTLDAPARRHALLGDAWPADRELDIAAPAPHALPSHRAGLDAAHLASRVLRAVRRPRSCRSRNRARRRGAAAGKNYWTHGGVVDFTGSRDPRAAELERRIVLSQYLTAINAPAGCRRRKKGCSPTAGTASSISRCTPGMRRTSRSGAGRSCWSEACPGTSRSLPQAKARAKAQRRARRVVAQDGRARRAREPEHGQSLHHVAAAASYLPGRDCSTGRSRRARRWRSTASWCSRPPSCWRAGLSTTARRSASCWGRR